MFRTWIRFNLVGALGMVVQLLFLALLHSMTAMHYMLATLLAVETAVLHNFLWHEKWTWKEQAYGGLAYSVTERFFRFHIASGLISLSGNLFLMRVFVEVLHLPIVLANLIAIVGCSLSNFLANSRFVFRNKPEEMMNQKVNRGSLLVLLSVITLLAGVTTHASAGVKLKPDTVKAFERYVEKSEKQMQARIDGKDAFLRTESDSAAKLQVQRGALLVGKSEDNPDAPHGMIQGWKGSMFIPDATLDETVKMLQDYDHHKEYYPEVLDSKLLKQNGDELQAYLKLKKKEVLTVVLNTEYEVRLIRVSGSRCHLRSHSVRITEVADPGKKNEKELPQGEDRGFLWRLNSYWWLEEVKDGVFVELETISLSRNVPAAVRWIVNPFVNKVPRESMKSTLEATRIAVRRRLADESDLPKR